MGTDIGGCKVLQNINKIIRTLIYFLNSLKKKYGDNYVYIIQLRNEEIQSKLLLIDFELRDMILIIIKIFFSTKITRLLFQLIISEIKTVIIFLSSAEVVFTERSA
jgi:hypothetical protein